MNLSANTVRRRWWEEIKQDTLNNAFHHLGKWNTVSSEAPCLRRRRECLDKNQWLKGVVYVSCVMSYSVTMTIHMKYQNWGYLKVMQNHAYQIANFAWIVIEPAIVDWYSYYSFNHLMNNSAVAKAFFAFAQLETLSEWWKNFAVSLQLGKSKIRPKIRHILPFYNISFIRLILFEHFMNDFFISYAIHRSFWLYNHNRSTFVIK